MRGGILSFSTNKMKKFKFKIHKIVFTNFIQLGNIKLKLKSDVFKALLILTRQF